MLGYILLLSVLKFSWMLWSKPIHEISVIKGQVDLTTQETHSNEIFHLDGEWIFYPAQLLYPEEFKNKPYQYVTVPSNWKKLITSKGEDNAYGIGTYHLRIHIPENHHQIYSLYFNDVYTSAKIYIDGELQQTMGQVSEKKDSYIGKTQPIKVAFRPNSSEVDVVVQVANHELPNFGGILKSVKFGTKDAVDQYMFSYEVIQIVTFSLYFLHSLYGIILYLIGPRKREILYYILFSIAAIVALLFDGSQLALNILPVSLEWSIKIKIIAYAFVTIFILATFKNLYKDIFDHRMTKFLFILNMIIVFTTIFIPIQYTIYSLLVNFICMILTFLFITYMNVKHYFYHQKYYRIFIVLNVCLLSGAISNIVFHFSNLKIAYYPFEMIFVFMGLTVFLFKHAIVETEETIKLSKELQKMNELKDLFITSIARELRMPIQAIKNMTTDITKTKQLSNENVQKMKLMTSASQHMTITLNNLFDISKLQEKNIDLERKPIDLSDVVDAIIPIFDFKNTDNIAIYSNIPEEFPRIYADESRMAQIMSILIQNALRYTSEGEIRISAITDGKFAEISVKDTGVGVTEELQDRIFNPYIDDPKSAGHMNTGLELFICKKLVQLHGGDIRLQSKENEGSEYIFTIPLFKEKWRERLRNIAVKKSYQEEVVSLESDDMMKRYKQVQEPHYEFEKMIKNAKVLLVDYDRLNAESFYQILTGSYDVTVVHSSEKALQKIEYERYDIVLSEVLMPRISGLMLTKRIREKFNSYELPIILFTTSNFNDEKYTAFSLGANDFILKPIDAIELKSRIYSFIVLKRSIKEHLKMEAAWLQAQIRPHFLFNTLSTIIALSYTNNDAMIKLLNDFSDYLRMSFKPTNTDTVIPLDEELKLVYSYLQIEKSRFGDRMNIMFNLEETENLSIPPLVLQTIIENAVRHGILAKREGGTIFISLEHGDEHAQLVVQDNGVGMSNEQVESLLNSQFKKTKGIGIYNAHVRLHRIFGAGLQITSVEGEGTTVKIRIPYHFNNNPTS